ncbi:MAG: hypothetical protein HY023_01020 [Chloroflexi bacterium]|nr:hypothetical protein [Chloroflexota bacterium]MBI3760276.1 hypothetical protein [Chloroflexota bacterium]
MTTAALARIAALYNGVIVAALLLGLLLIGRFYQRQARVSTGYLLFLVPAASFLVAGLRVVWNDGAAASDLIGDLLRFLGGACLIGLGAYLLNLMTGRRK